MSRQRNGMNKNQKFEPIIGLEVHVELATASKMFCGCPADHFGKEPNTQTCPVCLGLPGALPVPNKKAVEWTILLGLALGCTINEESKFDRKHYFYPDLPKGYQISQYDQPLCVSGKLGTIRIRRVHLEEDTGKLQHAAVDGERVSLVDLNRSGVPLVEVVTEPDFRSVEEVDVFVKKLQQIIRYLGVSETEMEKGTMRIEPSISIRSIATDELPTYRVEIKNINSFRFARKAIESEIVRQREALDRGEKLIQETRGFVESKGVTVGQREKEESHDYRYFPEPDIPPMRWHRTQISELKSQIGELPDAKRDRFIKEYGLSNYDATQLTETKQRAEFFERFAKEGKPKAIANIIINKKVQTKEDLMKLLQNVPAVSVEELQNVIEKILKENSRAIEDYKKGKEQALMFLVGQVKRQLKTGDSKQILEALKIRL